MQLLDQPWHRQHSESAAELFEEATEGMVFRQSSYAWTAQLDLARRKRSYVDGEGRHEGTVESFTERALDTWPRNLQILSIGVAFCAAIFAAGHVLSAAGGLTLGFAALTLLFFGNFAAFRRGSSERLVGPTLALLGTWGSLIITIGIGINAVFGA